MKILVVLPRFPWPLDKGDKLRAYHQIVELSKRHEIYLFALSHDRVGEEQLQALRPYCQEVHVERLHHAACYANVFISFLKGLPLQVGYWTSHRALRSYADFERHVSPEVVYSQMIRTIPLHVNSTSTPRQLHVNSTKTRSGGGEKVVRVLDFQDALSLNVGRRIERSRPPLKWLLNYEQKALHRIEQQALQLFDSTTVISTIDRDAITQTIKQSSNQAIYLVPNGVDTEYFNTQTIKHSSSQTFSICFIGNMAYAPNVDAARYLVEEIMPIVWSQIPSATVLLAGADPKPAVRALASDRVTVSGRLTDIRTAYAASQLFVAPMRIGSGMQNKLLEAMSMCRPCVTTTIAAQPLGATPGEHLLVGGNPATLADQIVRLLHSEELCHNIANGGQRFVQEHYSWPAAVKPLENIFYAQLESK